MHRRKLGSAGLELSVLGLGTWAMGGAGWPSSWGPQSDDDSIASIRTAIGSGINWIDTAPVYGLGHAEEVVARAIAGLPSSERPLVFTKCGLPWKKRRIRHRLTSDSIRREAEGSLMRLRVEAIDLYQIHWPDASPGGPAPHIEEAWATLVRLREEGKVRHIGVSNFDRAQLERVRTLAEVESLQPPYSVIRREIETEILPYCLRNGIGVIVYSPMESGLLSGKMTRERIARLPDDDWRKSKSEELREPRLSRNLATVEALERIGRRHGASAGEVAIAWTLRHPAVTGAIVGARRPEQIEETRRATGLGLTSEDLEELGISDS